MGSEASRSVMNDIHVSLLAKSMMVKVVCDMHTGKFGLEGQHQKNKKLDEQLRRRTVHKQDRFM